MSQQAPPHAGAPGGGPRPARADRRERARRRLLRLPWVAAASHLAHRHRGRPRPRALRDARHHGRSPDPQRPPGHRAGAPHPRRRHRGATEDARRAPCRGGRPERPGAGAATDRRRRAPANPRTWACSPPPRPSKVPGSSSPRRTARTTSRPGRITDRDLQVLVNGLWYAGAEAVAVNDNRVGTLTSIRTAGDAITVNYRSIGPPYSVVALGDPESLQTRLGQNPAGAYWEDRRKRSGVEFAVTPSSEVTLPAVPDQRLDLKHASTLEEDR